MRKINLTCANFLGLKDVCEIFWSLIIWLFFAKYLNFVPGCTVRKTKIPESLSGTVVINCKVEIGSGDIRWRQSVETVGMRESGNILYFWCHDTLRAVIIVINFQRLIV